MKVLVVYHSRWGNCEKVAEEIARGLESSGNTVYLFRADSKGITADYDLIVAGSPTRAGNASGKIRKFIKREISTGWKGKKFAAFGTGILKLREKGQPQSAGRIHKILEGAGLVALSDPFYACVTGLRGPLAQGELGRAYEFGKEIGSFPLETR